MLEFDPLKIENPQFCRRFLDNTADNIFFEYWGSVSIELPFIPLFMLLLEYHEEYHEEHKDSVDGAYKKLFSIIKMEDFITTVSGTIRKQNDKEYFEIKPDRIIIQNISKDVLILNFKDMKNALSLLLKQNVVDATHHIEVLENPSKTQEYAEFFIK